MHSPVAYTASMVLLDDAGIGRTSVDPLALAPAVSEAAKARATQWFTMILVTS
jgi:hypothetical protein